MITDNVQIAYLNGSGMGIPHVNFNWVQIGDASKTGDLYVNGMVNSME